MSRGDADGIREMIAFLYWLLVIAEKRKPLHTQCLMASTHQAIDEDIAKKENEKLQG